MYQGSAAERNSRGRGTGFTEPAARRAAFPRPVCLAPALDRRVHALRAADGSVAGLARRGRTLGLAGGVGTKVPDREGTDENQTEEKGS